MLSGALGRRRWREHPADTDTWTLKRVATRRDAALFKPLASTTQALSIMPGFQAPIASGSKRKHDQHDPNFANRKRQAVEDESSGVSAMEGDHYWMVQWYVFSVVTLGEEPWCDAFVAGAIHSTRSTRPGMEMLCWW